MCHVKEAHIAIGSKEHVYVTCYTSPENFFCQLAKTSAQLDGLMDQLEEFYRPLGDGEECVTTPRVGNACCAMFTEDDGWYRAEITNVSENAVEVNYIDYGNSEKLPLSRLKKLLPCFAEINVQGFHASLLEGACGAVENVDAGINGKELMVRVSNRKSNGVYTVEAYDMSGNKLFDSLSGAASKPLEASRTVKGKCALVPKSVSSQLSWVRLSMGTWPFNILGRLVEGRNKS